MSVRTVDRSRGSDRGSETDGEAREENEIFDGSKDGGVQGLDLSSKEEDSISSSSPRASTVSLHSITPPAATTTTSQQQQPPLSRTPTTTPTAIRIPRPHRRGLFAHLTLLPEITHPPHYPRPTKWFLTFLVAFCAMAAPMGSAIVMPVLHEISIAFHSSHTITNMNVAVYMLSMSIFPLWWSSFSERLGRRTIYIVSFALFIVFAVLSAVASNIAMLIVFRTLSGGAAASVQAVGAGTIADIWETKERGRAMGIFYLGPLCGPLFAPIVGGALGAGLGWRSTQWFLVVYGGVTLVFIVLALPETLHRGEKEIRSTLQRSTTRTSTIQQTKAILTHLRQIFFDPLLIISWLRFPPVLLTVYCASITFGSLYILNISIQSTFASDPYDFSTLIVGLLYIPNSAGYLLASLFGGRWIDSIMAREAKKAGRYDERGRLVYRPMDRMKENAWVAAFLWPSALIVYGWTARYGVHWVVPMIVNFFFGIGSMLIFALVSTMLTEFMPRRTASGIALNNFVRNIFSFTGAMVAEPVLSGIGNGWLMTILGLWSVVTVCAALGAMARWGEKWRVTMVEVLG
ncbi:MFS general substrate transporter [Plenodomus tracheiphilus IPT5]|uniref:MFS general substrate transporter n=1 Tax=Plenodomus tracheiphilus IPT5 TaxID=1408161 RepID=A0A6A7ATY4_9PLEO|nr:MFS general substrate transporter [Plenodomus tracheiphilus IPT5]